MKNIKINGVVYHDVEKINVKATNNDLVAFLDTDIYDASYEISAVTPDKMMKGYAAYADGEYIEGSLDVPGGYYWYEPGSYGFTLLEDSNGDPFSGNVGLYYYSGDDVYTPGHCIFTELTGISYGTSGHYYYNGNTDFEEVEFPNDSGVYYFDGNSFSDCDVESGKTYHYSGNGNFSETFNPTEDGYYRLYEGRWSEINGVFIDTDGYYRVYSTYDEYTHKTEYHTGRFEDGYYQAFSGTLVSLDLRYGYYEYIHDNADVLREINGALIDSEGLYEVTYDYDTDTYSYDSYTPPTVSGGSWYYCNGSGACDPDSTLLYLDTEKLYYTSTEYSTGATPTYETDCIWSCDDQGEATKYDSMEVGDEITITLSNGQTYKLTRIN